jgi:hypothetical protein
MCAWSDDALAALLHAAAGTLEELDLSRCKQVTDDTLAVIASACGSAGAGSHTQRLRALSLAFCTEVTAAGVDALLAACGGGLRLLDLKYVCRDVFFHRFKRENERFSTRVLCPLLTRAAIHLPVTRTAWRRPASRAHAQSCRVRACCTT